jgi:hypothetical protein
VRDRHPGFLADDLERLPAGDPLLTFVIYMCAYAHEVLVGQLPGPYSDHKARRFARAALVPEELADRDLIAHTRRHLQQIARSQTPRRRARHRAGRDHPHISAPAEVCTPPTTLAITILNWIDSR